MQLSLHAGQRAPREELTRACSRRCAIPRCAASATRRGGSSTTGPRTRSTWSELFAACLETGVAVEVNGLPDRLDLRGEHVRDAIRAGVRIVCSTDSHSTRGSGTWSSRSARRGAAARPPADVLNTLPLAELLSTRNAQVRGSDVPDRTGVESDRCSTSTTSAASCCAAGRGRSSHCSGSPSASRSSSRSPRSRAGSSHAQHDGARPAREHRHRPDRHAAAPGRRAAASAGFGGGRELLSANQSALTDLSKLGKPGDALRPRLLPAGDAAHVPAGRRASRRRGSPGVAPHRRG